MPFLCLLLLLLAGAYVLARHRAARERRRDHRRQAHRDQRAEVERRARQTL